MHIKRVVKDHSKMKTTFLSNLLFGISLGHRIRFSHFLALWCGNDHILVWFVSWIGSGSFNSSNSAHATNNFAKNNMSTIQPGSFLYSDEELRSIGVFSSIGHWQPSWAIMLELEVFIFEAFSIDGSATSTWKKKWN